MTSTRLSSSRKKKGTSHYCPASAEDVDTDPPPSTSAICLPPCSFLRRRTQRKYDLPESTRRAENAAVHTADWTSAKSLPFRAADVATGEGYCSHRSWFRIPFSVKRTVSFWTQCLKILQGTNSCSAHKLCCPQQVIEAHDLYTENKPC
jgi:hypothetical protein